VSRVYQHLFSDKVLHNNVFVFGKRVSMFSKKITLGTFFVAEIPFINFWFYNFINFWFDTRNTN
jgi:hypothetical protein